MAHWQYRFENYTTFLRWRTKAKLKEKDLVILVDVNTNQVYAKEKKPNGNATHTGPT